MNLAKSGAYCRKIERGSLQRNCTMMVHGTRQNQTGRAPNKWDKSGVIVECKPHDQINVMMDGSRRESLRN